ncbi:MAG TPA: TIGR03668 family PPOX class F420-dependent oxidoreductase [Dehalococcoidia bacterium]|jgi:PPOX class probable F420-dependent enzyme|nr:TIGR03668 family PPOX class F420-dependent oxidoreductase [Dehalococcoidia bacterium]
MVLSPRLRAFAQDARVGHLATVDERGRPHVVPVCFAVQGDIAYIALDAKPKRVPVRELRRIHNLLANPEVQLLIDRWDEDWSRLAYLQLRGRATVIDAGDEQAAAVRLLRDKYPQYRDMAIDAAPVIRIEVRRYVAWPREQS